MKDEGEESWSRTGIGCHMAEGELGHEEYINALQ